MTQRRYRPLFQQRAFYVVAMIFILGLTPSEGSAFDGEVEITSGYDDNITESPSAKGSGFTGGRFEWQQQLLNNATPVNAAIGMDGDFRGYFNADQRCQGSVFARLDGKFWKDRFYPEVKLSGGIYRNDAIPEDDADWFEAKVHADTLVNTWLTLGVEGLYAEYDYQRAVSSLPLHSMTAPMGRPRSVRSESAHRSVPMPQEASPAMMEMMRSHHERDDRSTIGRLSGSVFMGPQTTLILTLECGQNQSTVKQKAYDARGITTNFIWRPGRYWQADLLLSYQKADYTDAPRLPTRTDDTWGAGLKISRSIGVFELFFQTDWRKIDSTLSTEAYTKRVTLCGVSYFF